MIRNIQQFERVKKMIVELYNLSEKELQDLRTLEKHHQNALMLTITKNAFDGQAMVEIIIEALEILTLIIELILLWKKGRNGNRHKDIAKTIESDKRKTVAAEKLKIVVKLPNLEERSIEMDNVSLDGLKEFFNVTFRESQP